MDTGFVAANGRYPNRLVHVERWSFYHALGKGSMWELSIHRKYQGIAYIWTNNKTRSGFDDASASVGGSTWRSSIGYVRRTGFKDNANC